MLPNIGAAEIVLVLALALIVFGPRKLPEIGKSFGKTLNEFRRASFSSFNDIDEEVRKDEKAITTETKATTPKPETVTAEPLAEQKNDGEKQA